MDRYRTLFLAPDYSVDREPTYAPREASNGLATFRAIPEDSRYRFMLDDAQYFIMTFIKGPVCKGQVALNVIEDRFWVFFLDPRMNVEKDADDVARRALNASTCPLRMAATARRSGDLERLRCAGAAIPAGAGDQPARLRVISWRPAARHDLGWKSAESKCCADGDEAFR